MHNHNYAPVFISVYNRVEHFKQCLTSLSKCKGADKTIVYISSDGASSEKDAQKVKEIRKFIKEFKGFKEIVPVFAKENTNSKIIREASQLIYEKHDRLIRSEDDNIFSPDFLSFVNKGLDVYEEREEIYAICGYNSPVNMPEWYPFDVYLRRGYSAWGAGNWREKRAQLDYSLEGFNKMFNDEKVYKEIKKNYLIHLPQLQRIQDTGVITGDGLILVHLLYHKMYSVYPVISRVRNTGHDGSGLHCGYNKGKSEKYLHQKIYDGKTDADFPLGLTFNKDLEKFILKQRQPGKLHKIKVMLPSWIRTPLEAIYKYVKPNLQR